MKKPRINSPLIKRMTLTGLVAATFCSQALTHPQGPTAVSPLVRRGMVSGAAAGLSLQAPLGQGNDMFRVSPPLSQSSQPPAFDPAKFPGAPNYTLSEMFPGHLGIRIDAFSTGNDFIGYIHADGSANLNGPNRRWQGVTVSVENQAIGNSPASLLRQEPLSSHGSAGSLITHYLADSVTGPGALSPTLLGKTVLEQSKTDLGWEASSEEVIDGLDWALGIKAWAAGHPGTPLPSGIIFNRGLDKLYFSVSADWAATTEAVGFATDSNGAGVATRGGDIYCIIWDGASWGAPVRVLQFNKDLGLTPDHDVDALAYDSVYGTALYSTTEYPGTLSQILAYQDTTECNQPSVAAIPYRTGSHLLTNELGLDVSDDVTAICVIDPEPGTADPYLGVKMGFLGSQVGKLGICVERTIDGDNLSTIHLQATGTGGIPQTSDMYVEFFGYQPSTNFFFSQPVSLSPFSVAELRIPIGNGLVTGEWVFFAQLRDGSATPLGLSWTTNLEL